MENKSVYLKPGSLDSNWKLSVFKKGLVASVQRWYNVTIIPN